MIAALPQTEQRHRNANGEAAAGSQSQRVSAWFIRDTLNGFCSFHLLLCGRRQRDGGLGREQEKCQRLLQVEAHDAVGVAQITDRDVLADVQVEIAATGGEHEGPG